MTSTSPVPAQDVINSAFGPFVTGIMLQMLLMGVIVVLVWDYYRVFTKDPRSYKVLVAVLFGVSILQAVMDYSILYRSTVTYYGNWRMFNDTDWTMWWEAAITAIIGSIVQAFFLQRCWSATKSKTAVVTGAIGILFSLGSGIATSFECERVKTLNRNHEIPAPILMWLISTAVIDLGIAAVLILSLTHHNSHYKKTETVITRIVRLSFTTSALTAAIAVINVILYMALPSSKAYDLLPQLVMGKLYVISCMITLASRSELRNVLDSTENSSYVAEEACSQTPSGQTVSTKIEVPALPRHLRTQTHIAHITTTLPIPIPTSTSTSPTPTPSLTPKSSMTMMKPKPVRPGIMIRTTSFTRSDTGEVLPAPVPDVPKSQSEYRRDRHRDSDDIVLDRVHTINDGNEVFETAIQFPPLPVRTAADASTEELQSQFRGRSLTFSRLGRMA